MTDELESQQATSSGTLRQVASLQEGLGNNSRRRPGRPHAVHPVNNAGHTCTLTAAPFPHASFIRSVRSTGLAARGSSSEGHQGLSPARAALAPDDRSPEQVGPLYRAVKCAEELFDSEVQTARQIPAIHLTPLHGESAFEVCDSATQRCPKCVIAATRAPAVVIGGASNGSCRTSAA